MTKINIILATDLNGGIGTKDNRLPWPKSTTDMQLFKQVTTNTTSITGDTIVGTDNNTVVMGYNTWISMGCKPLPKRHNIIVSKNHKPSSSSELDTDKTRMVYWVDDVNTVFNDLDGVLGCSSHYSGNVFLIGGKSLYSMNLIEFLLENDMLGMVFWTLFHRKYSNSSVCLDTNVFEWLMSFPMPVSILNN
jgi:dihydrofolate reductase